MSSEIEGLSKTEHRHGFGVVSEQTIAGGRGALVRVLIECWAGAPATQNRACPCDDGTGRKGLGDVVVGSKFETQDLVDFGISRGEEEDRHLGKAAQAAADIEAENVWQSDIEDDEIAGIDLQPGKPSLSRGLMMSLKSFRPQGVKDGVRDSGLVFDKKD